MHINSGMNENQTHTTDLTDQSTTSYATEMSRMIPNLPTSCWQRTLTVSASAC